MLTAIQKYSKPEQYQSYVSDINDAMAGKGFEIAAREIKNLLWLLLELMRLEEAA